MNAWIWACVAATALLTQTGCQSSPASRQLVESHQRALARTGPERIAYVEPGSDTARNAVERFREFYAVYSVESIRSGVRDLYAEEAYFGDPFKAVTGLDSIETYFIRMAEPIHTCTFVIDAVNEDSGEFFFLWTMNLRLNRAPDDLIEALGFSHVRFDTTGKVVFQQDYWDTSVMFERLPVVGGLTRAVKRRLD